MKNELKAFVTNEQEEVHDNIESFVLYDEELMKGKKVRNRKKRAGKERKHMLKEK